MIFDIVVNVSLSKHTITKKDYGVMEGDYNTTKLVFKFDEDVSGQKIIFSMSNPEGELVLMKELDENKEIVLAGFDDEGKVYSIFKTSGLYPFELELTGKDSRLTSATGWLTVGKKQVNISDGVVDGVYLPVIDDIYRSLEEIENTAIKVMDNSSSITDSGIYKVNEEIIVAHGTKDPTELISLKKGMVIPNTSGLYFTSIDECFKGQEIGAYFDLITLGFSNSDETFDVSIYDERVDADEDFSWMIEVNGNYAEISNSAISGAEVYIPLAENIEETLEKSLDELGDIIVLSITETGEKYLRVIKEPLNVGKIATEDKVSNALKGNKSGEIVGLNDISPIEHELKVNVSGVDNLKDVILNRLGKNLFRLPDGMNTTSRGVTYTANKNSSEFTMNGTGQGDFGFAMLRIRLKAGQYTFSTLGMGYDNSGKSYGVIYIKNGANTSIVLNDIKDGSPKTMNVAEDSEYLINVNIQGVVYNNLTVKLQIEQNTTATEYEPYIEPTTYTVNADGTVEGVTSLYPTTTLTTDTEGALIEVEYNRDINKAFAELQQALILAVGGSEA